jgi:transposase
VLILNNTSCYRSQELKDIYNKTGVILKFLPPYSPDFNLIKESFLILKAWVQKNHQLKKGFEDFSDFLELAVKDFIKKNARGYFRLAEIRIINKDKDKSEASV